MRKIVFLLVIFFGSLVCIAQEKNAERPLFHGDLPQALLWVDQKFHVSVLGEIVEPVPSNIVLEADCDSTATTALAAIVSQCPGYLWVRTGGTFVVAQKKLYRDSANPMNQVLPGFGIPDNLTTFELLFPNAVAAAAQHKSGRGGLLSGLGTTSQNPPVSLESRVLHHQTARAILVAVADQVGNLYSVVILPNSHPVKENQTNTAFAAWVIAGGPDVESYKVSITAYPQQAVHR
jgi:hypothetical protein